MNTPDAACMIVAYETSGRPHRVISAECGRMAATLMLTPTAYGTEDAGIFAEVSAHFAGESKAMRASKWAHRYADRIADADMLYSCRHGHLDCALVDGGTCVDEALTAHESHGGCDECEESE